MLEIFEKQNEGVVLLQAERVTRRWRIEGLIQLRGERVARPRLEQVVRLMVERVLLGSDEGDN